MGDSDKKKRWPRRVGIALATILVACGIGFGAYVSDYYRADTPASKLSTDEIPVVESDGTITVGRPSEQGIVFYPGAKVDPAAYVPLMQKLADEGLYCVIAKMPFNLAFFGINAADSVIAENPETAWWIAGHSLGGAMAAQYAVDHADNLEGIAFLAAYAASDLSNTDLEALVIYGSEDGVLNRENFAANEANLPENARTIVIEGGNHANFGNYGPQEGDGEAGISADDQQRQVVEAISAAAK